MATDRAGGQGTSIPLWVLFFLIPFFLAGLFAMAAGLRMAVRGETLGGAAILAFGALFAGLPSLLFWAVIHGRRQERRLADLQASEPDRPWLWRPDFASGVLRPEGGGGWIFALVFSLVWNAAAGAGAWLGFGEYRKSGDWRFLLILLFPAAGAGLLWWTVATTGRWLRYRRSALRLDATPVPLGGRLKGTIELGARVAPEAGFEVTLECLRRTRDTEGDPHDLVLWERRTSTPAGAGGWSGSGTTVPVAIPIPEDCEPWDDQSPDRQVIWRLRVSAEVEGPNVDMTFEAPVFRTRPRQEAPPREALPEGFLRVESGGPFRPPHPRVRISEGAAGSLFVFPPQGGAKVIPGFLITAGVTGAAAWGVHAAGAPPVFPLAIGLFGLIPALAYLWSAAGEVRIRTGAGGVELTYELLGLRKTWKAAPGEVAEAGLTVTGQTGPRGSYAILLRRRSGKPLWVLVMLNDKREAEWIAEELNRRLPPSGAG